jgi:hypothetical protein
VRRHRGKLVTAGLSLLLTMLWLWRQPPPPRDPEDICAIYHERLSWYRDSRRTAARWEVSEPVIMAILFQESGFRAHVRPPRRWYFGFLPGPRPSTASGYAQVVDATWRQFQSETRRRANRRRFADAVDFVGWYVSELRAAAGIARSDTTSLYLAYHEGPRGYARGSHVAKPGVARSAERVAARARRFEDHLGGCRAELDRALTWRTVRRSSAAAGLAVLVTVLLWWRFVR